MMREEYPRPQFVRNNDWVNLNGEWQFTFDDQDEGQDAHWQQHSLPEPISIQVPFVYQSKMSGVNDKGIHDIVWYQRDFTVAHRSTSDRYVLHFGAIDYYADVYVNDQYVGHHEGGDGSFSFDITSALTDSGSQRLTVRGADRTYDETLPRGKQSWTGKSEGIWYTNTTGIWQPVWLETVPVQAITALRMTPDLDDMAVDLAITVSDQALGQTLSYQIKFGDTLVVADRVQLIAAETKRRVDLGQSHIFRTAYHNDGWAWTPENPQLFDVTLQLHDGATVGDEISSYFGLRKVSTENGMILLNNKPYYQKLVLDQGYWPDSLMTAPSDQAFIDDIKLAKAMGLNGCRKHQKIEDPRFLYWADKLGYLVWEEVASVPVYTAKSANRLIDAWQEAVERDYNHPSIIMWVPLNESWGVDMIHQSRAQQHFSQALYHLLHAVDGTRLVGSNDGWDNTETDIVAIHNYSHGSKTEQALYQRFTESLQTVEQLVNRAPGGHPIFAQGYHYQGQPIVLTEFGGIGFDSNRPDGWGYTNASSTEDYLAELTRIFKPLTTSQGLWGYCYTQLTDCEQEVNGLLTADRQPKAPVEKLKAIFDFPQTGPLPVDAFQYRQ